MSSQRRSCQASVHVMLAGTLMLAGCAPKHAASPIVLAAGGPTNGTSRVGPTTPTNVDQPPEKGPRATTPAAVAPAPEVPIVPVVPLTLPTLGAASPAAATLSGLLAGPASIIANNGAGIISNNGSALIANNGAGIISNNGSALISNNGSGYRVLGAYGLLAVNTAPRPLANAFLYLGNRDEKFYRNTQTNQAFTATTSATGAFSFPIAASNGFPVGRDVVVNAIVNGNLRLTGYLLPLGTDVQLNVDLGSTLATELLRGEAYRTGRSLGSYDPAAFAQIVAQTQQGVASNALNAVSTAIDQTGAAIDVGTYDLRIDHLVDLRNQYTVALSAVQRANAAIKALSDQWLALIGYRPTAVTTVAGSGSTPATIASGLQPYTDGDDRPNQPHPPANQVPIGFPYGVASAANGDIFLAAYTEAGNSGHIRWFKHQPDGSYKVSTIFVPVAGALVAPIGLCVETQPPVPAVDYTQPAAALAGVNPGSLLVADYNMERVYRIPIVDQPALDGSGNPLWPMQIVAGDYDGLDRGDPNNPNAINPASWVPVTGADPAHSRWRLAEEAYDPAAVDGGGRPIAGGDVTIQDGTHRAITNPAKFCHLSKPTDVKVDEYGDIYITEADNSRVRMIPSPQGLAALGATPFDYRAPQDPNAPTDATGSHELTFGSPVAMRANHIYTIVGNPTWQPNAKTAADGRGRWFGQYANSDNNRAQAAKLSQPGGLAFDRGFLYIADFNNNRIRRASRATGLITTYAGNPPPSTDDPQYGQRGTGSDRDYIPGTAGDGGPANQAQLAFPRGLAFDAGGRLYVTDSASGRIRMIDTQGVITTVAGRLHDPQPSSAPTDNLGDGDALNWADLYESQNLAVDPSGNVLFADRRHLRLRKLWRQWQ